MSCPPSNFQVSSREYFWYSNGLSPRFQVRLTLCSDIIVNRMKRGIGQALPLRSPVRALFSPLLKTRAISSVVERLLHTQEVGGSNPPSRMSSPVAQKLALDFTIERSPRRQVAG